jgi:DivIVA domain-containing protein
MILLGAGREWSTRIRGRPLDAVASRTCDDRTVTLLFTLLTLAVLGVIAAVATGKIAGGLEDPSTSLPGCGLPEGPLTPGSLEAVRFSPALRGYRMAEVDLVVDRLGAELVWRDREILRLTQQLRLAERSYVGQAVAPPEWAVSGAESFPAPGHPAELFPGAPSAVPQANGDLSESVQQSLSESVQQSLSESVQQNIDTGEDRRR